MKALTTVFPVLCMLGIGCISRIRGWITREQASGTREIIFKVFFPVMIFNAVAGAGLTASSALIILYVTVGFMAAWALGKLLSRRFPDKYSDFSPYLLMTVEGGSVALPLYLSIVDATYTINTITFDIAGCITAFLLVPMLVMKESSHAQEDSLLKQVLSNSFVLAVLLGLAANMLGVYEKIGASIFAELFVNTRDLILSPITAMILFTLGYDLQIDTSFLKPLFRLSALRILAGVMIILGFFLLFPQRMAQREFMIAVLLYFMCPTGFALPLQLKPVMGSEDAGSFASVFLSSYILVTIIVYVSLAAVFS